jgi:Haem-binding domain
MKKVLRGIKWLAIALICLLLAIQFIRPARTNPAVDESQTIFARTQMTPQVAAIIGRSCRDCHSNKTIWPWYSNVAPVSWFVIGHVHDGRRALNLSEWARLDPDRQSKKLQQMCDLAQDASMPLSSYTPMHPGSKLSADDVKMLCEWTESERSRINSQSVRATR